MAGALIDAIGQGAAAEAAPFDGREAMCHRLDGQ